MRCENLSKRLNRYTILFLIMDLIILLIDLFSCHNHTKFLFLISTIFIINCLFFDFCKKHIAYTKISIFYIWQFNYKDTFNKLGYKAKINTHTTSCINLFLDIYLYSEYRLIYC